MLPAASIHRASHQESHGGSNKIILCCVLLHGRAVGAVLNALFFPETGNFRSANTSSPPPSQSLSNMWNSILPHYQTVQVLPLYNMENPGIINLLINTVCFVFSCLCLGSKLSLLALKQ